MSMLVQTEAAPKKHEKKNKRTSDMSKVVSIILGGGQGKRLFPLTESSCKPAICFGGRYRLIDIPISNAINSNCHRMFVITQFLSRSIHNHISRTYHADNFSSGMIEMLSAEQKPTGSQWFQGTADAVRQNLTYLKETPADYFLILSGDQIYNMDFHQMLHLAQNVDADLVIASLPVNERDAKRFGILQVDAEGWVRDFYEKPQDSQILSRFRTSQKILDKAHILPGSDRQYVGSMGIYLFKRKALFKLLEEDTRDDFGQHLIPSKVKGGKVAAFLYDGYWEDIGTIEAFYQANIALTQPDPSFNFHDEVHPIYTLRESLPGVKISQTKVTNSLLCEGSVIEAEEVTNSILGLRTVVKRGTSIRDSYIMGNDFYHSPLENGTSTPESFTIGENCTIRRAILDRNVRLGKGVQLINREHLTTYDSDQVYIRDGIIVVPRGANLPDGFTL